MPRRLPRLLHQWLFPRSLRGRYLQLALVSSLVLLLAASLGWYFVRNTTESQIERIQSRTEADMLVSELETTARRLEIELYKFINSPGEEHIRTIRVQRQLLAGTVENLRQLRWFRSDDTLQAVLEPLSHDIASLQKGVDELIRIRTTAGMWFPAMQRLEENMLPQYNRISAMITLSISELESEASTADERQYLRQLTELRYLVERMISEFRLLISNRFGVFSDTPIRAISLRLNNIELYRQQIRDQLDRLAALENRVKPDLILTWSMVDIRDNIARWTHHQQQVVNMLVADDWRYDISYLEKHIQPLIDRTQQRLESIKLELGVGSARDITRLTEVANRLSYMVILLTAGGILALLLWFLIFNRTLLVPIGRIAEALRHEAKDDDPLPVPQGKVTETRLLTEAFDEMRKQVRSRQAHLDYLAYHDPLTGLPNRTLFRDRLQHAIDRALRDGKMVSLLFLDLDRFKQINDSLGHDVGDELLRKMATRLQENVRTADTVARLGGDEFAVIVEDVEDNGQLTAIAEKILGSFEEPFKLERRQLHTTTSIGIATCPADGSDVETLFRNADTAMYYSKERGPNGYFFYSDEMTARITTFLLTENQLRSAIRNNEFELHYHPVIDLSSGEIAACETLLRWTHDKRGILLPAEFLDVLEETGLIMPVSHWIIRRALSDYTQFRKAASTPFALTINFSPNLLRDNSILDILGPALESNGIPPSDIIIEITEEAIMHEQGTTIDVLLALKKMGVRIAIDDFGKGQSSLSRLRKLPIDIVKIDKDFVAEVPGNTDDSELITAIIAMAHNLRKWVVAEGVEDAAQYEFLREHDCDAAQGFLFSLPLSAGAMYDYLKRPAGTDEDSELRRKAGR